jgi:glycosyltransferase involved in cell wall biosynthesis
MRMLYDDSLARNPAGTGTFVRGLRSGLHARTDIELVTVRSSLDGASDLDVPGKRLGGRLGRAGAHLRHYLVDLPGQARAQRCDAIFCPTSLGPLRGRIPSFITLFDLSPLTHSATMDRVSGQYIRAMLGAGLKRSAGVCTISRAVADEIGARYPSLQGRIAVAYPGPNGELIDAVPSAPDLPDAPFLLMVGTLEPRKNHLTIVRALHDHVRRRPGSPLRLVLAGSAGWLYQPVLDAIGELGLESRVVRLGKVEPGVLKWLYQHAAALLFPSLYEGFGLPVLEAFALGCPVVAARIGSVVEIADGDAAVLLEPTGVPAWAAALDSIEAGALPPGMVEAARQRAQRFTWAGCADAVVTLIRSSLQEVREAV